MTASLINPVSLTRVISGDPGRALFQPSGLHVVVSESTLVSAASLSRSSRKCVIKPRRDGGTAAAAVAVLQGFSTCSSSSCVGSGRALSKKQPEGGMWRRAVCRGHDGGTTIGSSLATWRTYMMGAARGGRRGGGGGAGGGGGGGDGSRGGRCNGAAPCDSSKGGMGPSGRPLGTTMSRASSEAMAAGFPSEEFRGMGAAAPVDMAGSSSSSTASSALQPPDVADLAERARISVSAEEILEWSPKIGRIVDWFGQLQKIDLDGVEPASRPAGVMLKDGEGVILRADVKQTFEERSAMLEEVPQMIGPYIKVPRIRVE